MAQGMSAAVADMKDDSRECERQFDVQFGYDDEDPIERHVRLHLTPHKPQEGKLHPPPLDVEMGEVEEQLDVTEEEEEEDEDKLTGALNQDADAFRPGLIQFHRQHSSKSIIMRTDSSNSNFGSGTSTPMSRFDASTPCSSVSMRSEASFEAIKADDVLSLYGRHPSVPSRALYVDSPAPSTPPLPPADRSSITSTTSNSSTATPTSATSTISAISAISAGTIKHFARPGLVRPRPRAQPYPGSSETRQRERENSGGDPSIPAPPPLDDVNGDEWLAGRTISETMVAKAGLRCQRGRRRAAR